MGSEAADALHDEIAAYPAWQGRVGRFAAPGIALVLLALFGTVLGCAIVSYRAGAGVREAYVSDVAITEARQSLAAAQAAAEEYRTKPAPEVRARLEQAAAAAGRIARISRAAGATDREVGAELSKQAAAYSQGIAHYLAALDGGDRGAAEAIDRVEVVPAYDAVQSLLERAPTRMHRDTVGALLLQEWVAEAAFVIVPVAFVLAGGLIALFWNVRQACARYAEENLARQASTAFYGERRFRGMVQNAAELILVCDAQGKVLHQNLTATRTWYFSGSGLVGRSLLEALHSEERAAAAEFWEQVRVVGPGPEALAPRSIDVQLMDGEGQWRHAEMTAVNLLLDPAVEGILVTIRDSTHRKAFERQLTHYALYDDCTRLPNRMLLEDRLEQALVRARRAESMVGLILLELTVVGDDRGRPGRVADELMVEAAWRLRACVRAPDTIARIRTDRLVVVLEGLSGDAGLQPPAKRIAAQFAQAFAKDGAEAPAATWSVGMAIGAPTHDHVGALLSMAEVAVGHARGMGPGRCVLFDTKMNANALDQVELQGDLAAADLSQELCLHFQPFVHIASGAVRGLEALVRWQHPVHGLIAPRDFLSIAADTGLIVPLGRWVLDASCRQVVVWQRQMRCDPPLTIAVNLSAQELWNASLIDDVATALRDSGLPPASLILEVSEGVVMQDVGMAIATLWKLKALGVQLAMDDFGVGGASVAHLRQLPLDVLKIDGSLIGAVGQGSDDLSKVQASVALGRSMGFRVSGEGIETAEQAELLGAWRCDLGQGYYYGRPAEGQETAEWLRDALSGADAGGAGSQRRQESLV